MAPNLSTDRDGSPAVNGRRISRWLDRALIKSGFGRTARSPQPPPPPPPPPPPLLPSPRPSSIIRSSNLLPHRSQKQSILFSLLPIEIRRGILLYAFGNRTMHMELTLDHPMPDESKVSSGRGFGHGGFAQQRDVSVPRKWLWRSCVCHRNPPWLPHQQHHTWNWTWHKPDIDTCLEGKALCNAWSGESPYKCRVGALGWLLSCRQAYDEGIELLYTSNTFYVSGEYLLTRISDYILPARLAQMSAFEVFLSLSGSLDGESFVPASTTVSLLLKELARSAIKRLYLCIHCPIIWGRVLDVDLTKILEAVDEFVRVSGVESTVLQMDEFSLRQLATSVSALEEERALPKQSDDNTYRIWRSLDGVQGQERLDKRICLYPRDFAPLKDVTSPELGRSQGYWILESHNYKRDLYV